MARRTKDYRLLGREYSRGSANYREGFMGFNSSRRAGRPPEPFWALAILPALSIKT